MIIAGLVALILLVIVMRSPAAKILAIALIIYVSVQAEIRHDREAAVAAQQ